MKLLANSLFIIFIILFVSCKKSEKGFIGKYKTFYPAEVKLSSAFNYNMFYYKNVKHTAKLYYELLLINVNIFLDESDKRMKGEAMFVLSETHNFSMVPTVSKSKMDFDVINFRMEKDTLHFQIENQLLKLSGKRINGILVNGGDGSILGLETEAFGTNNYTNKNPYFIKKYGDLIYYKIATADSTKIYEKIFYDNQINDLNKKISESKNNSDSIYFQNSIEQLKSLYNQ